MIDYDYDLLSFDPDPQPISLSEYIVTVYCTTYFFQQSTPSFVGKNIQSFEDVPFRQATAGDFSSHGSRTSRNHCSVGLVSTVSIATQPRHWC